MHSHTFRFAALTGALSSLIAIVACSGGTGTAGVGGAPVPADQIGKTYVDKVCAAIQTCCNQNGFADDFKTCAQGAAGVQAEFDKDRSRHPEYTYDAQKAGNCLAKLASAYGTCNPKTSAFDSDVDPDCDGFLKGNKAAGASCTSSNECGAIDSTCARGTTTITDGGTSSSEGVCVSLKRPVAGDPCFTFDEQPKADKVYGDCQSDKNFYCDPTSKTCKARGGAGTPCMVTVADRTTYVPQACAEETTCDSASKQCAPMKAVGEACTPNSATMCVSTAFCDSATSKCVAKRASGEACDGQTNQCVHGCDTDTKKCRVNDISRNTCAGDLD